jgi:hypothetical protein
VFSRVDASISYRASNTVEIAVILTHSPVGLSNDSANYAALEIFRIKQNAKCCTRSKTKNQECKDRETQENSISQWLGVNIVKENVSVPSQGDTLELANSQGRIADASQKITSSSVQERDATWDCCPTFAF